MSAAHLGAVKDAARSLADVEEKAKRARVARDQAVVAAVAAGIAPARVAPAAGVTRQYVATLVRARR